MHSHQAGLINSLHKMPERTPWINWKWQDDTGHPAFKYVIPRNEKLPWILALWVEAKFLCKQVMSCGNCFIAFLLPSLGDQSSVGKLRQQGLVYFSGNGCWECNVVFLFTLLTRILLCRVLRLSDATVIMLKFTVAHTN